MTKNVASSHQESNAFSCEFCERVFSRRDNLNDHRRRHANRATRGKGSKKCRVAFHPRAIEVLSNEEPRRAARRRKSSLRG